MGCDIHAYVEFQWIAPRGESDWQTFAKLDYEPRHYALFGALTAGEVRGDAMPDGPPLRGIPLDIGWETKDGWYEDHTWTVVCPDNHTPNWVTADELAAVLRWVQGCDPYWDAVVAAMRALDESGTPSRLVFWFDN